MNNNLKVVADYHTHTIYSDGKGTIEQNVKSAIDKGLEIIGISDHGYKHMGFGVKYNLFEKMRYEIDLMKEKYPQIKILLGVECNILDDRGNIDIDDKILGYFDYVMAGYHFGSMPTRWTRGMRNHFNNYFKPLKSLEKAYNTRALINAMRNNDIFVLTHPGDKGDVDIIEVAKAAQETKTYMEINSHHKNLSIEQLTLIKNIDVEYILGSDSHLPNHVGDFTNALERAISAGVDIDKIVNVRRV